MITEQYVTYETAKMLKEAGFDVPVYDFWNYIGEHVEGRSDRAADYNRENHQTSRPTQSLAARWLREYCGIHVSIEPYANMWHWILWKINGTFISNSSKVVKKEFESYEEAMEAGLQEALKLIIKDKKDEEDNVQ